MSNFSKFLAGTMHYVYIREELCINFVFFVNWPS